jgi:hypothetical protein
VNLWELEPHAKEALESALGGTRGIVPDPVIANYIGLSIAISAKRQADAAASIAQSLETIASWGWQGTLATTPFSGGN